MKLAIVPAAFASAILAASLPVAAATDTAAAANTLTDKVQVCPDGKYQSGCDFEEIGNAVMIGRDWAAMLGTQCLYRTKARCFPLASGQIIAVEQGRPLTWQHMELFPKDGPRAEMLVLIEGITDLDPVLLAARQTDGWYSPPELAKNSAELLIVHISGRLGGSGSGNADIILSRHSQGWTTFNAHDLLDDASAMLPPGFSLASGVNFDFREMFAAIPVKRESDGGCCTTGGTAFVDFEMVGGNWMQVASVVFNETTPVKSHQIKRPEAESGLDGSE